MDMAVNMSKAIRACFPKALTVIDRFHVQKLAYDAVQELRIQYRWEAIEAETQRITEAKAKKQRVEPEPVLSNGDTVKQMLARSRYLLFKQESKWTDTQKERANLLFEQYPDLRKAYKLSIQLGHIYKNTNKELALTRLARWNNEVEAAGIDSFGTVSRTLEQHHEPILRFFINRSTNASAESFNAKIKAFRATSRGVRDINFFLYRISKIYA